MSAKIPLKLIDIGAGKGQLKEFEPGDTIDPAFIPGASIDTSGFPFVNLMSDSGKFAGRTDPLLLRLTTAFAANSWITSYNGSVQSSYGKFTFDNSTNGGAAAAIPAGIQNLLTAMGRTGNNARYGVEFFVDQLVAGTGTAIPAVGLDGVTRYLASTNNTKALAAYGNQVTFVGWVAVTTGSMHLGASAYIDGVLTPAGTAFPSGWHHIRMTLTYPTGYSNSFPNFYCTTGATMLIACPGFFNGAVNPGIHSAPLPTVNELNDGGGGSSGGVGPWISISPYLASGFFSAVSSGYPGGFFRLNGDVVEFRGFISKSGSWTAYSPVTMCTMPAGYRVVGDFAAANFPYAMFPVKMDTGDDGSIHALPSGALQGYPKTNLTGAISLDALRYSIKP